MPLSLAKDSLFKILSKKNHKLTTDSFDELWSNILSNIITPTSSNPPILELILSPKKHRLLKPQLPFKKSILCKTKLLLVNTAQKWSLELAILGFFIGFITLLYSKRQLHFYESCVISILVDDIVDAVQQESIKHSKDSIRNPLPGLDISQLKEHFLPIYSSRQRILKPIHPKTGYPCEKDSGDRMRWFLDESGRERVWAKVYEQVGGKSGIKEVLMELGGEGREIWIGCFSEALTPKPKTRRIINEF